MLNCPSGQLNLLKMEKRNIAGKSICASKGTAKNYFTIGEILKKVNGTLVLGDAKVQIIGLSVPWSAHAGDICVVADQKDFNRIRSHVTSVITVPEYAGKIHGVANVIIVENAVLTGEMLMEMFSEFYKN